MKLSAGLFSNLVLSEDDSFRSDIGLRVGQSVRIKEGVFQVEAKIFSPDGFKIRFASKGGTVLSKGPGEIQLVSPLERKLASFIRLAFNSDFDQYIKECIRDHNLPVDEEMNWSKWWESKTRHKFSYAGEELRDEAVHNLIIWAIIEHDKLSEFNPSKLPSEVQQLPVEKQVTIYLQRIFNDRMDYIYSYIDSSTGNGKEVSGESKDEDTPGALEFAPDIDTPHDLHEKVQDEGIFRQFRHSFFAWLVTKDSGFQKRSIEPMKILFDLIILSEDPKPRYIVSAFEHLSGASASSMKGYIEKLAKALVDFSKVAPDNLGSFSLIRKLQAPSKVAAKTAQSKESDMSLKDKINALRAKHAKQEKPKVDKWAKLRRIAEEEPEAMGEAVSELTLAFAELADAADSLAENLNLVPGDSVESPEESKEEVKEEGKDNPFDKSSKKKASKKIKYAANFKKIAFDEPGSLADALVEVYQTLDTVAEGIENLAQNLGIDLPVTGGDDLGMDPLGGDMGLDGPVDDMGIDPLKPLGDESAPPAEPLPAEDPSKLSKRKPFKSR